MRETLLRIASACVVAITAYTPTVYGWDDPYDLPEARYEDPDWRPEPPEHHRHRPMPPEPVPIERDEESLSVTVPRHARRGLATTLSLRYRKVSGNVIVRLRMSPGLYLEQANPPAARGPDGELLWFGLAGPTGNLKIKARIDPDVPVGTALLIQADLIDGQGKTERQTETIVVR